MELSRAETSRPFRDAPDYRAAPEGDEFDHEVKYNPSGFSMPLTLGPDPVLQMGAPTLSMPAALITFPGQGNSQGTGSALTPPDTNGAVGPNHYVQATNIRLAVWNKNGTVAQASKATNYLWAGYVGTNAGNGCAANNSGDPVVIYDQLADRWFITQFSLPNSGSGPNFQCVAVSKTGDPLGTYSLYDFRYPGFNDYGKFGLWPDAYYASFNSFNVFPGAGAAEMCAYDRIAMLQGNAATQVCFQQSPAVFGVLPASLDGIVPPPIGETEVFLGLAENGTGQITGTALSLWQFHADFATPANSTLTGPTSLPVAPFTIACLSQVRHRCVVQPSGGALLESLADRPMFRLVYRNFGTHETLLANHAIVANSTSGIRWYEIRAPATSPTIFQSGTFAPNDGNWRWMASLAEDQAEDFALGYSVSGPAKDASIAWTGQINTDPVGSMAQGEAIFDNGTGLATFNRWGDYSNMVVDPTDDCTFWYTQELFLTSGFATWDTQIASVKFPNCAASDFSIAIAPASRVLSQNGSVTYTVTTASTRGSAESVALNIQDLPSGVSGVFVPASVTAGATSTLTLTATAVAPPTGAPAPTFTVIGKATSAVHAATAQVTVVRPPTVAITSPANGATVSGTTPVTATATAAAGTALANVTILIDGVQVATGLTSPLTFNWDTTAVPNGPHTIVATAADADGGTATSATVTVTVRNNPTVAVTSPANGATVSGTVPVTATASSALGTTLTALLIKIDGVQVVTGATSPQTFNWDTTTLANGSTHTIAATATDADGGTTTSATVTVTIKNNPTVAITSPANGATVNGTVAVSATGTSALGTTLASLSISIDGTQVATGVTSPQTFSWDTTTLANAGTHTITATVTDADGGAATASITVTVKNNPKVQITAPANGATVSGSVPVTAVATAATGSALSALVIKIDGTQVATAATSPETFNWDTTTLANGSTHAILAIATDADGASATSTTVTVTVKNNPTVSITTPADGATVTGTVPVTAAATVPAGTTISTLAIRVDGNQVASGAASPDTFAWDTTTTTNGAHTLSAIVTDADGTTATSSIVNVTVSNTPPTPDAGAGNDAGTHPDAGVSHDSGASADSGSAADSGSGTGDTGNSGGCGCTEVGGGSNNTALGAGALGLLGLVFVRRRRATSR